MGGGSHALGSAPRQMRGSAQGAAASVSPSAPGVTSDGKLCVAGCLWPGRAFSTNGFYLQCLPSWYTGEGTVTKSVFSFYPSHRQAERKRKEISLWSPPTAAGLSKSIESRTQTALLPAATSQQMRNPSQCSALQIF